MCEFDDCCEQGSVTMVMLGSDSMDAVLFMCPAHAAQLHDDDPEWQVAQ